MVFNTRWLNRILLILQQIRACLIYRTKQDSMTTMCLEQNFVVTKCNVPVFILAWLSHLCVHRMVRHLCNLQVIVVTIGRLSSFWKQGPILTYRTRWEHHELLIHCIYKVLDRGMWGGFSARLKYHGCFWCLVKKALGWYWVDHFVSSFGLLTM